MTRSGEIFAVKSYNFELQWA